MARHRDPAPEPVRGGRTGRERAPGRARRSNEGPRPGTGPYDGDSMEPDAELDAGTTDFGALRVPVPAGGAVMVEPPGRRGHARRARRAARTGGCR